ncbi:MAG TPA: hypothetical protein VGW10_01070 [Solirubrobacteraceae bacterium]|nr:hypothetical protein [Solirubrobacteraceae bacterium]
MSTGRFRGATHEPGPRPIALLLIGLALAALTWRETLAVGEAGIDPSWRAGLHMAAHSDLAWGRDVIFTFGPLGFLEHPTAWFIDTSTLALAYTFLARVALATVLWSIARPAFGRAGAALTVLAVMPFVLHPVSALVFAAALWLLAGERRDRDVYAFALGTGVLAGVGLLVKLNTGVLVTAMGLVAVACAARSLPRQLGAYAATVLAAVAAGWLATGQSFGDLDDYARNATEIVSGYSGAMLRTGATWHFVVVAGVLALAAYGVWDAFRDRPARRRAGALAMTLLLAFVAFKNAFVRHDLGHVVEYFSLMLPALLAIPWRPGRRALGFAGVTVSVMLAILVVHRWPHDVINPFDSARTAWNDVTRAVWPGEAADTRDDSVASVREARPLDPATLALLDGQTVHVEPYEAAVAWAYDLDWKPLPVFQSYQAYTARLDRINADTLARPSAPSRVLLAPGVGADPRVPGWESPAAVQALLCRYRPLGRQGDAWLVLGRTANRCGEERPIGSREARWGEPVAVPPASAEGLVTVRIAGVEPGAAERLRAVLFKGHERRVTLDGEDTHPLVPETVENGLLLHAPETVELPAPFTRAPGPRTIAVQRGGGGSGTLRYEFFLVPVERP